jgi:hypothetical protein
LRLDSSGNPSSGCGPCMISACLRSTAVGRLPRPCTGTNSRASLSKLSVCRRSRKSSFARIPFKITSLTYCAAAGGSIQVGSWHGKVAREYLLLSKRGPPAHSPTKQLFCVQSIAHSLHKTPGVGGILSHGAVLALCASFSLLSGPASEHQTSAAFPLTGLQWSFGRNMLHRQAAGQVEHE